MFDGMPKLVADWRSPKVCNHNKITLVQKVQKVVNMPQIENLRQMQSDIISVQIVNRTSDLISSKILKPYAPVPPKD